MSKLFESNNPMLSESAVDKRLQNSAITYGDVMTVDGAMNKSLILFSLLMVTAFIGYTNPSSLNIIVGAVGGLIAVLVASFKPNWSPIASPVYALLEGLFVGSISAMYATAYDGIVGQAVMLTMGTLVIMLAIYKANLIPVTQKFKTGVFMATGAIALVYLASWIMGMFGINMPYIHEGGMIGIGISVVIIGVAALNLLIDFDSFEKGEEAGAPKYMEWFFAMGLLVTLVWLYIEFLRLLSKLQRD